MVLGAWFSPLPYSITPIYYYIYILNYILVITTCIGALKTLIPMYSAAVYYILYGLFMLYLLVLCILLHCFKYLIAASFTNMLLYIYTHILKYIANKNFTSSFGFGFVIYAIIGASYTYYIIMLSTRQNNNSCCIYYNICCFIATVKN